MRIAVKGVGFDPVTLGEAEERCRVLMAEEGGHYVVTPNPEIVWLARKMPELKEALNGADLVIPDGIGVIYAARILSTPLKERVPGIELTEALLASAAAEHLPVFLPAWRSGRGRGCRRNTPVLRSSAAATGISRRMALCWNA